MAGRHGVEFVGLETGKHSDKNHEFNELSCGALCHLLSICDNIAVSQIFTAVSSDICLTFQQWTPPLLQECTYALQTSIVEIIASLMDSQSDDPYTLILLAR
jgi:hypothetical protein